MRSALAVLLSLVALATASTTAHAQGSPRAARALLLMRESAAVMVASDRAWLPDAGEPPLSICAGERCAPVRAVEQCDSPRCPGPGVVAIAARAIAGVGDYPTGCDEAERERAALLADPVIASSIGAALTARSCSHDPPRWQSRSRGDGPQWELSLAAGPAYLAHSDVGSADLVAGGGVRFQLGDGDWDDGADGLLTFMYGNLMGADLRAHVLPNLRGQTADDFAVAIGLAPITAIVFRDEVIRVPSFFGTLLPELGVIVRGDRDPAFYAAWNVPFAVLLDEHVGLEARATAMIVDDWVPGDDVEAILSATVAVVVR